MPEREGSHFLTFPFFHPRQTRPQSLGCSYIFEPVTLPLANSEPEKENQGHGLRGFSLKNKKRQKQRGERQGKRKREENGGEKRRGRGREGRERQVRKEEKKPVVASGFPREWEWGSDPLRGLQGGSFTSPVREEQQCFGRTSLVSQAQACSLSRHRRGRGAHWEGWVPAGHGSPGDWLAIGRPLSQRIQRWVASHSPSVLFS